MKIPFQLKNLIWYQTPFIISSLIPLITLPIFTNYLSINDYGLIALANVYGVFFVGILNLGLLLSFQRNFFEIKKPEKIISLFWSSFFLVFMLLVLFFLISHFFQNQISKVIFKTTFPPFFLLFSTTHLGLKSLMQYFYTYFKNYEASKKFTYLSISETLLCVLLSLYFVVIKNIGLVGYVLGQAAGISTLFIFMTLLFIYKKGVSFDKKRLTESLRLGFPLIPQVFFGVINKQFDRYMLGLLSSLGSVGIYDISLKISNVSFSFISALEKVYSPKVYRNYFEDKEGFGKTVGKYLSPYLYLVILASFIIGMFSEELLYLLTPSDFHSAYPVIIPLVMLNCIYFYGTQPQLLLVKKTFLISKLSFLSLILNIFLNIPMIMLYGIYGASWATFSAGLFVVLISFYFSQILNKINYSIYDFLYTIYFLVVMLFTSLLWHYDFSYLLRLISKIFCLSIFLVMGLNNKNFKAILKNFKLLMLNKL